MKAVLGLGCAVCLTAAPVNAGSVEYDFSGKFLLSDTSLIDTNQSQSLEAVSTAGGRFPSALLQARCRSFYRRRPRPYFQRFRKTEF